MYHPRYILKGKRGEGLSGFEIDKARPLTKQPYKGERMGQEEDRPKKIGRVAGGGGRGGWGFGVTEEEE